MKNNNTAQIVDKVHTYQLLLGLFVDFIPNWQRVTAYLNGDIESINDIEEYISKNLKEEISWMSSEIVLATVESLWNIGIQSGMIKEGE